MPTHNLAQKELLYRQMHDTLKSIAEEAMSDGIRFEFKKAGRGIQVPESGSPSAELSRISSNLISVFGKFSNISINEKVRISRSAFINVVKELDLVA